MATTADELNNPARRPLIIVCCHAIYLPAATPDDPAQAYDESNWLLADFQRSAPGKEGEHLTFVKHVQRARELAGQQRGAVIVLSGGATKRASTAKSEAQGYLDVLRTIPAPSAPPAPLAAPAGDEDIDIDNDDDDAPTVLLEQRATDSFQNVLFSLLEHRRTQGAWPSRVTVVTHAFKAPRIAHHLRCVRWPRARVAGAESGGGGGVEGVDPPFGEGERRAVERSERRCLEEWRADCYGVRPPLSEKRAQRGWRPDGAVFGEMTADAAVRRLLEWDGTDGSGGSGGGGDGGPPREFPDALPWEE